MFSSSPKPEEQVKDKVRKKWWLCHAVDFESLMQPCFFFSSILGLFPYKIEAMTFVISKTRFIVSCLILSFAALWGLAVLFEVNIAGDIHFDGVPGALQCNCYYILGGCVGIITVSMTKRRLVLLQAMLDISSKLPPIMYQKMSRLLHAKDILGFGFILLQVFNCYDGLNGDSFLKLMSMYITMLVFEMDMLYMNCICILKASFVRLNENLESLRQLMINEQPHLLRRIYHEERNPYLLTELKALKKRHLIISDTVHMLNTVFSMQILTTIVMTFAEITFGLYFYIMMVQGDASIINLEKQIWFYYYLTSTTYYSVKIMFIVWACDTSKDQAVQVGTTVHDVLINTSDKELKEELQLFSLQVLHRENSYTAKGLSVDATLLTSIVGSIATYLLILIQFLVTAKSCHNTAI